MTEAAVAETTTPAAIAFAAENLGREMLDALMSQIERMPGWSMAAEKTRSEALQAFKAAVEKTIQEAIRVIGTGQFPACAAVLSNVSFGGDIRATLKIDRSAPGRHQLIDMAGLPVVILMASPEDYLARMQDVKARSAQGDLFGRPAGENPDPEADPDDQLPDPDADLSQKPETGGEIRQSLNPRLHTLYGKGQEGKTAGDAAPPADELPIVQANPGDEHISLFLRAALDQLEISVTQEFVTGLTQDQRLTAWQWAQRKQVYPHTRMPRPAFLPIGQPPTPDP